jgi:hypothetical protein
MALIVSSEFLCVVMTTLVRKALAPSVVKSANYNFANSLLPLFCSSNVFLLTFSIFETLKDQEWPQISPPPSRASSATAQNPPLHILAQIAASHVRRFFDAPSLWTLRLFVPRNKVVGFITVSRDYGRIF